MDPRDFFDEAGRAAIRRAADSAEGRSSGEIVPYVVGRSDDYPEAAWTGASLGAIGASGLAGLVYHFGAVWGAASLVWLVLPAFAGAGLGFLAGGRIPAVGRRLISAESIERRVRLRAEAAFLEERVFDTRDRTGILVMVSLHERRALVLADAGINAKVAQEEWQAIVDRLVAGIRQGQPAVAMAAAITECGDLLASRKVERRDDDENELSDELRIHDR
jgi:putative membrane protein